MKPTRRQFIGAGALAAGWSVLQPQNLFSGKQHSLRAPVPTLLRPSALHPGDTVAVISPAGAVWDDQRTREFIEILENLGLTVKQGKTLTARYGYLAGKDNLRAAEVNDCFTDESVKAIFCAKGGWGCARLLPLINYNAIAKNPKIIMGFSDITSLLLAIQARTGLVTFHGPVGNSSWGPFSMQYVKNILFHNQKVQFLAAQGASNAPVTLTPGKATGRLLGGNLSVLSGIIGSDYLPDWENSILFLEDTDEEPFRIDRMLTQLKLSGVLTKLSGIVFGQCSGCVAEEPEKAFTLEEVLQQHIQPLGIPAFYNAMIGHITDKFTLPLGIQTEMNATLGTLRLLEKPMAYE